jgi:hypothetical protein
VARAMRRISLDQCLPLWSPAMGMHGFKALMGLLWAAVGLIGHRSCHPARNFIKSRLSKKISATARLPLSRAWMIARSSALFFRRRQVAGRLRI